MTNIKHKCCNCKKKRATWYDKNNTFGGNYFCNDCVNKIFNNSKYKLIHNNYGFDICKDEHNFYVTRDNINDTFNNTCIKLPYYDIFDISNAIDEITKKYQNKNEAKIKYNVFMSKLGDSLKQMKKHKTLTSKGLDNIDAFFYNFKKNLSEKKE